MMMVTPIPSLRESGSERISAATSTPKKGFRKWKVAALTGPILLTRKNQISVPSSPGTRVVYIKASIKLVLHSMFQVSKISEKGNRVILPTSI
jgi:hypothetical protein